MRNTVRFFVLFSFGVWVVAGQVYASQAPYGYGFLGGNFTAAEDATFSTWNDIHFACHFFNAQDLQHLLEEMPAASQVLIGLSGAWHAGVPACNLDGPWGNVAQFISRVEPLLATLEAHRERIFALWLFDEPDAPHNGPADAHLRAAIDYVHQAVPGLPVFVNWFSPERNTRLPNADWYATTKGEDPAVLAPLGKPMFLWWFNNEEDPHPAVVNWRWQTMVSYFYKTAPPPIVALGWCCDSIDSFDGPFNDNSVELTALLANLGHMRRTTGAVARAPYAQRPDGGWYLFRREPNGELSYTDILTYPFYRPLPIGGTSPFYPAVSREYRGTGTWIRLLRVGDDRQLYVAWITPEDQWIGWERLPGQTGTKPDVVRFRAVTWQAIRGLDGTVAVMRDGLDPEWVDLGGEADSAPFFKTVNGELRVAVFWADGQVYARRWNGAGWDPWAIEP